MQVPAHILKFVGRSYLGDFGSMALGMRVGKLCFCIDTVPVIIFLHFVAVTALVPYDFMTRVFALGAPFMKDYSKNNKVNHNYLLSLCTMRHCVHQNRGEVQQKK